MLKQRLSVQILTTYSIFFQCVLLIDRAGAETNQVIRLVIQLEIYELDGRVQPLANPLEMKRRLKMKNEYN